MRICAQDGAHIRAEVEINNAAARIIFIIGNSELGVGTRDLPPQQQWLCRVMSFANELCNQPCRYG